MCPPETVAATTPVLGTLHPWTWGHNMLRRAPPAGEGLSLPKSDVSNEQTSLQGCRAHNETGKHNTTKGHSKLAVTDRKEMEILELPDKEFKILFSRCWRATRKHRETIYETIKK